MAFSVSRETVWGFTVPNAYCRVEQVQLVAKDKMTFCIRSYLDASMHPHFCDKAYECEYNMQGQNPIKQAYEFAKSLPEFTNAIDC